MSKVGRWYIQAFKMLLCELLGQPRRQSNAERQLTGDPGRGGHRACEGKGQQNY